MAIPHSSIVEARKSQISNLADKYEKAIDGLISNMSLSEYDGKGVLKIILQDLPTPPEQVIAELKTRYTAEDAWSDLQVRVVNGKMVVELAPPLVYHQDSVLRRDTLRTEGDDTPKE